MTAFDRTDILDVTRGQPRETVLRFREDLRRLLRDVEDMHRLPRSFETSTERKQREHEERRVIHHE